MLINSCTSPDSKFTATQDPYERVNRKIFVFNQTLDKYVLEPASKTYNTILPNKVKSGVSNHLNWINTPTTIINSGLQLEGKNLSLSSIKFLLNSLTLGFYDLDENETNHSNLDFGSTLAKYKFSEGPYLMLPFFGPRTFRHFTGDMADSSISYSVEPNNLKKIKKYEIGVEAIDKRSNLSLVFEDFNSSADPYIKLRSLYLQNRRNDLYLSKDYKNQLLKEEEEEFENLLQ